MQCHGAKLSVCVHDAIDILSPGQMKSALISFTHVHKKLTGSICMSELLIDPRNFILFYLFSTRTSSSTQISQTVQICIKYINGPISSSQQTYV